jgi:hypothetical protein
VNAPVNLLRHLLGERPAPGGAFVHTIGGGEVLTPRFSLVHGKSVLPLGEFRGMKHELTPFSYTRMLLSFEVPKRTARILSRARRSVKTGRKPKRNSTGGKRY